MAILRRLIRSTALSPRCADDQVLSDIRQDALRTAQNAINFVNGLRPDHLEAFWYFSKFLTTCRSEPNRPYLTCHIISFSILVFPPRIVHNLAARHFVVISGAELLEGYSEFIPMESEDKE